MWEKGKRNESLNEEQKQDKTRLVISSVSFSYYLGKFLCIGKIIHSNGQEYIQESV